MCGVTLNVDAGLTMSGVLYEDIEVDDMVGGGIDIEEGNG